MPWKYAVEYVCDVISASQTYDPKNFDRSNPYNYFEGKKAHYFLNKGTSEFLSWCFKKFAESGWKELKKKQTKAKYEEIASRTKEVDVYETEIDSIPFPELKS